MRMYQHVASWLRSLVGRPDAPASTRRCEKCDRPAAMIEFRPSRETVGSERHFCLPCARRTLWIPNPMRQGAVIPAEEGAAEVPVEVERMLISGSDEQLLVFRETEG